VFGFVLQRTVDLVAYLVLEQHFEDLVSHDLVAYTHKSLHFLLFIL
jgi:hypothetical protein